MLKQRISLLVFLISSVLVNAQPAVENETAADTVYKKVLLVPYQPMMHLSNADQDIAEFSEMTNQQVRAAFRAGLTGQVNTQLLKLFPTQSLLSGTSPENEKDLDIIYGSMNYEMDTVFPVSHPKNDSLLKKKSLFAKSKSSKLKEIHEWTFMNNKLSHPELLTMLGQKYGADLFVFLNQFEIVTNYDDCLDLALKIYRRQFKVHYSVYDVTGKELYGDVAVVDFPSNTNDIREIMGRNFPKLAEALVRTAPVKKDPPSAGLSEVTRIHK